MKLRLAGIILKNINTEGIVNISDIYPMSGKNNPITPKLNPPTRPAIVLLYFGIAF